MNEGETNDKRVQRSKAAVLTETYRQLSQAGIGGLSIDEVSRRSGVSKTTIYRHWPSRSALLIDACSRLGNAPVIPDTGSWRSDLRALAQFLAGELRTAPWTSVYPSIIDAAERDPEIAMMQAELNQRMMAPFEAVTQRAKARGEIAAEVDVAILVAASVGPFFYRRWFSKEAITEEFVEAIVEAVVRIAAP